jgi:hypothetical protein
LVAELNVKVENRRLSRRLAIVAIGMFGFGFALVPFYEQICAALGVGSLVERSEAANTQVDFSRQVVIELDANAHAYFTGGAGDEVPYAPVLRSYCRDYKMVNVKAMGADGEDLLEVSFYVMLKKEDQGDRFIRALRQVESVEQVNLFFDEE